MVEPAILSSAESMRGSSCLALCLGLSVRPTSSAPNTTLKNRMATLALGASTRSYGFIATNDTVAAAAAFFDPPFWASCWAIETERHRERWREKTLSISPSTMPLAGTRSRRRSACTPLHRAGPRPAPPPCRRGQVASPPAAPSGGSPSPLVFSHIHVHIL